MSAITGSARSSKVGLGRQEWRLGAAPHGVREGSLGDDDTFVKICYFVTVLRCMHDYTNQFNIKWKKENQFGGRKVVGQVTMLAHWPRQKVGRAQ